MSRLIKAIKFAKESKKYFNLMPSKKSNIKASSEWKIYISDIKTKYKQG